jgi:glucose-6-phosphate isomerase, archaeal
VKSTATQFDLTTGLSPNTAPIQRRLSDMAGMYLDEQRRAEMVTTEDSLVYEFYDMAVPERPGAIAYGTTILYPGKVSEEYFMTKGHFHSILDTAEVYYCLRGKGLLLMENPEGDWEAQEMTPGAAVYVPERFAHRSINTDPNEPLVSFFAFPGDAGHDYGTIETQGFRKLVVNRNEKTEIIDNPRWCK